MNHTPAAGPSVPPVGTGGDHHGLYLDAPEPTET